MNRLYWGDNLQVMSHLMKEFRGGGGGGVKLN
jgi:site-specific DNA-methyltransferase (adenine-specific)/adenine-specific DNA-methyltransferase